MGIQISVTQKEKLPRPEPYIFTSKEQLTLDINDLLKQYPVDHIDYVKGCKQLEELKNETIYFC